MSGKDVDQCAAKGESEAEEIEALRKETAQRLIDNLV
jgi:hypothetical protein